MDEVQGSGVVMSSLCDGCPAAHALGLYASELTEHTDDSVRTEMQRNELKVAAEVLSQAAGNIGCRDIEKTLPPLRKDVGELGSLRLINYARKCKAFREYLKLRRQMAKGQTE